MLFKYKFGWLSQLTTLTLPALIQELNRRLRTLADDLLQLARDLGLLEAEILTTISARGELLDPRDFPPGLSDDPSFDCWPAIQAALDQAFANSQAGFDGVGAVIGTDGRIGVYLPEAGTSSGWRVNKPLWVRGSCSLVGSRSTGPKYAATSRLFPGFGGGYVVMNTGGLDRVSTHLGPPNYGGGTPTYFVAPTWASLGFDAAFDVSYPGPKYNYFDFRECSRDLELHGLAQLCVEFSFKAHATTIPDGTFLSSMGRWRRSENLTAINNPCFRLSASGTGFTAAITTSTGTYATTLTGVNLYDGTAHRIILDYDGAHLRTYIDTTLVQSVVATGTMYQHDAEGVFFGRHYTQMPYVSVINQTPFGYYGAIKFSKVARYAGGVGAGGDPAGFDADTLFITDWTNVWGPSVGASTPSGIAYMICHHIGDPQSVAGRADGWTNANIGTQLTNFVINSLIGGNRPPINGVYVSSSGGTRMRIDNVHVMNGARIGICFGEYGNAYGSAIRDCYIAAWDGRYALLCNHNVSLSTPTEGLWLSGARVLAFIMDGQRIGDSFFECSPPPDINTPNRDDGGGGTRYAIIAAGMGLGSTFMLDNCSISTEAGAYDLESEILIVHGGVGPMSFLMRGGSLEQFTSTFHALPGFGATQPYIQTDSEVRSVPFGAPMVFALALQSGPSFIFDGVAVHQWGAPRAVEFFASHIGDIEPAPSVLRNMLWDNHIPPKALSATPGQLTLEARTGTKVVPCQAGAAVVYDAEGHATSAANASSLAWSIVTGAGSDGLLLIAVSYVAVVGGSNFQSLLCGVTPFNVTRYPILPLYTIPTVANYGDVVTHIFATQNHALGAVVDIQADFTGPVGAGNFITGMAVSLRNVKQGLPLEGFGVWASRDAGAPHTVHQDTYETLRPDCMVVDFVGGGPGAVPIADAGQTARAAVDVGTQIAYGSSTKPIATAARTTAGWTLASTSVPSTHVAIATRPSCVTFDALDADRFSVLLDQNVTLSHLVHFFDGMEITVILEQNGVGGWTFAWPANVVGGPVPAAGANAVTVVTLHSDGSGGAYAK